MFRDSADVSAVAAEKLKRLAYTNGSDVCFSDLQAVEHVLPATDFQELVAQLYREPAYSLRLHVSPGSDVDALVKYWGKGGREKLIAPLLKGLARAPGGGSISISYLLPPFARLRLYTFPDAWNDPTASQQDCFFTALNFFNEKADTNYFDRGYTARFLAAECAETDASPALGDIIALKDSNGDIIHASVYIADGFVFTKNGINHVEPWILMRMADMVAIYFSHGTTGKAVVLRRKA